MNKIMWFLLHNAVSINGVVDLNILTFKYYWLFVRNLNPIPNGK